MFWTINRKIFLKRYNALLLDQNDILSIPILRIVLTWNSKHGYACNFPFVEWICGIRSIINWCLGTPKQQGLCSACFPSIFIEYKYLLFANNNILSRYPSIFHFNYFKCIKLHSGISLFYVQITCVYSCIVSTHLE